MKKRKKFWLWSLILVLSLSLAGEAVSLTAFAATRETELTNILIDSSEGALFDMDWEITGDNTTAYKVNNRGHFARYDGSNGANGCYWLMCGTPVDYNKEVIMEFDLLSMAPQTYFGLCAWETSIDGMPSWNAAYFDFMYSESAVGWFPQATAGTRYRFKFAATGTVSISSASIKKDGQYTDEDFTMAGQTAENYFAAKVPASGSSYFGLKMHTASEGSKVVEVDNFVLTAGGTTVMNCDFEDESKITDVTAAEGKMSLQLATVAIICEYNIVDPAGENRIIMAEASKGIRLDDEIEKCAKVNASIRLDKISADDKAGLSFGLVDKEQAVTDAETSFVYLYNSTDGSVTTTYINVLNGGIAGDTPISLGKDYTDEYVELTLDIAADGRTAVTVGDRALEGTLSLANAAGMVAVDHISDSDGISYSVGKNLIIKNYSYLGGSGSDVAVNFNTGYVNENNFVCSFDGKAALFEDSSLAKGVVTENGKLFFKGSSDGDYISTAETYADFILEFEYTNFLESERPATNAQKGENPNGAYSPLIIQLNAEQRGYSGAPATGDKIVFYDGSIYKGLTGGSMGTLMRWEAHKSKTPAADIILENGCEVNSNTGAVVTAGKVGLYGRTTQFKIVAANGEVKVYAFNIEDGKTFADYTDADYILIATYSTKNCYGYVSIASSESGYFQIDNLRITNIDGKSETEVNNNVAAYQSLQAIPDESKLSKPRVTLKDNVATWTAVDNATGYEIVINDGNAQKVGKDVLSYTFTQTEPGDYRLTVRAVYEGDKNIHASDFSRAVTYTVESKSPTPGDNDKPAEDKGCGGCGSGASTALAAMILLAFAVVIKA